jgi:hypothetical protein
MATYKYAVNATYSEVQANATIHNWKAFLDDFLKGVKENTDMIALAICKQRGWSVPTLLPHNDFSAEELVEGGYRFTYIAHYGAHEA